MTPKLGMVSNATDNPRVARIRPSHDLLADWKFISIVVLSVLILTSVPYAYAFFTSPRDLQFMGIILNPPDNGEYFAWMRESMRGFFISNTLTPEPNPPLFFNLVFWILGQFALAAGLAFSQVYQIFRLLSGAMFLTAAYYFCSLFLSGRTQRRVAFLLIAFSSGFSVYLTVLGKFIPALNINDRFIAEGNTLFSIMAFPLLIYAVALITMVFAWAFRAYTEKNLRYAVGAGTVALVLGLSHGYDLILIYAVLGAFTLVVLLRDGWAWHWLKSAALIVALSCAPALYFVNLTRSNAVWRESLTQFVNAGVYTPNPLLLLAIMGFPLILTLCTFDGWLPLKERARGDLFLKTWFGINFLLIYLPVEYQIHFLNGWQVPIGLLATIGLFRHVLPRWTELRFWSRVGHTRNATVALLVLLFIAVIPSNLYFVGWRVLDLSRFPQPYFLHRDQIAALDWLRTNTAPGDVVLSSYAIGNVLPGYTGNRAFLAHWAMTLGFYDKRDRVERFFNPATTDAARLETLNRFNVRYIYWSEAERGVGGWSPDNAAFLEKVWSAPNATVYRFKPSYYCETGYPARIIVSGTTWRHS